MSVGYKTFGFCDECPVEMPDMILHDDPAAVTGLQENMRALAAKKGWTQEGGMDYCPECSRLRQERAK